MRLIVAAFGVLLLVNQVAAQGACRQASDDDHAHGANEIIEYSPKTVSRIHGSVSDATGAAMNDVVVEAYSYKKSERRLSAYEIANSRTRIAAALTDKDGNFCFRGLRSGRYVLRIGTRQSAGFQEVFIKTQLDHHWWSRWVRSSKGLSIELPVGT